MADWDAWSNEAERFDIEYELSRYNESEVKTYRETIKKLNISLGVSHLMYPSAYSLKRRFFTPK